MLQRACRGCCCSQLAHLWTRCGHNCMGVLIACLVSAHRSPPTAVAGRSSAAVAHGIGAATRPGLFGNRLFNMRCRFRSVLRPHRFLLATLASGDPSFVLLCASFWYSPLTQSECRGVCRHWTPSARYCHVLDGVPTHVPTHVPTVAAMRDGSHQLSVVSSQLSVVSCLIF